MKVSKAELVRARGRLASLQGRVKSLKKKSEQATERVVRTVEIGSAAFTMGVVKGKTGGVEIVGVPLDLGLGLGLNFLGYLGLGGKMSDHLHSFGDGCLASYATTMGVGAGMAWDAKKDTQDGSTKGHFPSDAELRRAALDAHAA